MLTKMFFHFSFVSFFLAPIPKNVQTVHFSHLAFGFDPPWSFWLKSENISAGVVALFWEEEKGKERRRKKGRKLKLSYERDRKIETYAQRGNSKSK